MPIALGREFVKEALETIIKEDLAHYYVRCPKCRTTNRVSRKQLQRMSPKLGKKKGK